jgi:hypothetical protein
MGSLLPAEDDPRIEAHERALGNIQTSVGEVRERFMNLFDQVGSLNRKFDMLERARSSSPQNREDGSQPGHPGTPNETLDFNARDEILQEIAQLRLEVDQRLLGLTPQTKADMSAFAPLPVVRQIATNFQVSIDELDQQIATIKDFLKNLVSKNDLEAMVDKLQVTPQKGDGTTAGGKISCLLCGKMTHGVTGMIMESEIARLLGTPPQCGMGRTRVSHGEGYVLTYGRDVLKGKKKPATRAVLPPIPDKPVLPPVNPPVTVAMK